MGQLCMSRCHYFYKILQNLTICIWRQKPKYLVNLTGVLDPWPRTVAKCIQNGFLANFIEILLFMVFSYFARSILTRFFWTPHVESKFGLPGVHKRFRLVSALIFGVQVGTPNLHVFFLVFP